MTSKTLFFKLLWEDIKRKLWAAALLSLSLFFALPVAMAMILPSYRPNQQVTLEQVLLRRTNNVSAMLDFGSNYPFVMMIFFISALVMGISTFVYLHNKKQVDFYHSLPVKRNLWFAVHISTGILIPAGIYLAAAAVSLVVAGVNGVRLSAVFPDAVHGFLCHMLYYCLIYITVVLAVIMTGTKLAAILGTAVFFIYFPTVSGLIEAFYSTFFETYYYGQPSIWKAAVMKLSPIYELMAAVSDGVTTGHVAATVGAVLLLGLLSFFLYQKRPSEAAGKTMAFSWSMGTIKVLLVIVSGMMGSLFFYSIRDTLAWMIFGVIVGVVISHCVIEVIYHSDLKKLFCHEKTMAACMAASLFIALSFYFDFFRYDEYVPSESQVAYSSIDFGTDGWVSYNGGYYDSSEESQDVLTRSRITNTEAVFGLAREGIRQLGKAASSDYEQWSNVTLCYTMKSGRKVYRRYYMYLDPVMDLADEIYLDSDYKRALYPGLDLDLSEVVNNMVYRDITTEDVFSLSEDTEKKRAVAEAYRQEYFELSMTTRETECVIGELLMISDKDDQKIRNRVKEEGGPTIHYWNNYWYDGYFYPIYPSFTKTIEALADCGIQVGESLAPENFKELQLVFEGSFEDEAAGNEYKTDEYEKSTSYEQEPYIITYTEPEKIREIMKAFSPRNCTKNNMILSSGYVAYLAPKELRMSSGSNWDRYEDKAFIRGFLIKNKVPDFVEKDFRELAAQRKNKQ